MLRSTFLKFNIIQIKGNTRMRIVCGENLCIYKNLQVLKKQTTRSADQHTTF